MDNNIFPEINFDINYPKQLRLKCIELALEFLKSKGNNHGYNSQDTVTIAKRFMKFIETEKET